MAVGVGMASNNVINIQITLLPSVGAAILEQFSPIWPISSSHFSAWAQARAKPKAESRKQKAKHRH